MGIGVGSGENRAVDAATNAINNPLLEDARIEGAQGILVNVAGGPDFSLLEYEEIVKIITANADNEALIIPGTSLDEAMEDRIQVTVVATGFSTETATVPNDIEDDDEGEEIIRYKDWLKMREGIIQRTPNEYLMGRNSEEADLGIPTVLRDDRGARSDKAL